MSDNPLLEQRDAGVLTLTINRPDKLNALNAQVIAALASAFEAAADDPSVRVVVLTGAGEKAFVAGADITELQGLEAQDVRSFLARGQALMNRIERLGKPVVAAINGFALGGGCELALACTLRVATASARLGLPEVNLGLIPGYGGTQRLARLVGHGRALHLMLTGSPVSAGDAQTMGLVTQVVEDGALAETVQALAVRLAAGAPLAQQAIMACAYDGNDLPLADGLALEIDAFERICSTADMREGTSAFLEKRPPRFLGE